MRRLLEARESEFNGRIGVFSEDGQVVIRVGGLAQSGGLAEVVIRAGLEGVFDLGFEVKDFLILGMGGGTAAKIASGFWPGVRMVGVEIDPVMVELGEKYMDWRRMENLEVVNEDGLKWLVSEKERMFDLILVDMYKGEKVAEGTEDETVFRPIKERLRKGGVVLVNRLFVTEGEKVGAERAVKRWGRWFGKVEMKRVEGNLWVIAH